MNDRQQRMAAPPLPIAGSIDRVTRKNGRAMRSSADSLWTVTPAGSRTAALVAAAPGRTIAYTCASVSTGAPRCCSVATTCGTLTHGAGPSMPPRISYRGSVVRVCMYGVATIFTSSNSRLPSPPLFFSPPSPHLPTAGILGGQFSVDRNKFSCTKKKYGAI